MNTKLLIGVLVLVSAIGAAGTYYLVSGKDKKIPETLPTYFSYSQDELRTMQGLSSEVTFNSSDLVRFDEITYQLIAKTSQEEGLKDDASKIYAYLMMAERDFAFVSHAISGKFAGKPDLLLKRVLCAYFEKGCDTIIISAENDPYSEKIAEYVLLKIRERMAEEASSRKQVTIRSGETLWSGEQPSIGIFTPSNKGWFIVSGDQFRSEPPFELDSKEFKEEIAVTKGKLEKASTEEKFATVNWAGGPGTKMLPGQLLQLATERMSTAGVSLSKFILVRSLVAAAVADADTAVFDTKYAYQVKRPYMVDPTIITIMPTPNHPSYTSGHSTLSMAGAVVLARLFPEDANFWLEKAEEAGMSRVWGGIHYMMDHEAGKILGRKVGEEAIKTIPDISKIGE